MTAGPELDALVAERRWRVMAFAKCTTVPSLLARSDYLPIKDTHDMLWDWRSAVGSRSKLIFWIEPEGMTEAERLKFVPMDVRDEPVTRGVSTVLKATESRPTP